MLSVGSDIVHVTPEIPFPGRGPTSYGLPSVSWLAVFTIHGSVHSAPARHPGAVLPYRPSASARTLAARVRKSFALQLTGHARTVAADAACDGGPW
ncbi:MULTISPECIES: hypothetical protein [unclassified Streptomyces]|uniref:hypothetical protein n=1 Tax=unclassified Streptomyces TaxID=2593676 RepID=UPI0036FB7F34